MAFTIHILALSALPHAATNGMDMSMNDGMTLASGTMITTLHFSLGDTLWFAALGPIIQRWAPAVRAMLEAHWRAAIKTACKNEKGEEKIKKRGGEAVLGLAFTLVVMCVLYFLFFSFSACFVPRPRLVPSFRAMQPLYRARMPQNATSLFSLVSPRLAPGPPSLTFARRFDPASPDPLSRSSRSSPFRRPTCLGAQSPCTYACAQRGTPLPMLPPSLRAY
ncbi:hypothetical protein FB451DRAFT_1557121 [Mycena latifolia]|nr:hypothetical protein FB451DRAFT_1557121 [Mycena latifolia]